MFEKPVVKKFHYGNHTVTLETGVIARQATSAVMITMDDTAVLVSVVGRKEPEKDQDFFPLTVNYQERKYAAGKVPGGFFKREGRPSEGEILTARLIDRSVRPLFPGSFSNEVQIVATVMAVNPNVQPDIPAVIGTSAALAISGIPFNGPIGIARVGYVDDQLVLNPSDTELRTSRLDLIVAGTSNAVLMVESEADLLSEGDMLAAIAYGHEQQQSVISAISDFAGEVATPSWSWKAEQEESSELVGKVAELAEIRLAEAYQLTEKAVRYERINEIKKAVVLELTCQDENVDESKLRNVLYSLEREIVRKRIISGAPRIDGREKDMVRALDARIGILPRIHGSALFTRGETQAVVTVTLGTQRDAQIVDELMVEKKDHFLLHYNFPPYCTGETGFISSPKRREVGHGRLAKRGLTAVMPSNEDFPYTVRVVSEITESNGSSSMASVCGSSLALMDAGVPIKSSVAGVAMGLVKEGTTFVVLSDILGDEDHLGDMDFKVAGTSTGITALQMDIKIEGITEEIMRVALNQARSARLHILSVMDKAISLARSDISQFAPRIHTMRISSEKIKDVIGKGGSVIRALTEETGTTIEIDDDGTIKIAAVDEAAAKQAMRHIEEITAEVKTGMIYTGKVARITDFGAFVTILPGKDGLVHISQIAEERVEKVSDYLSENQEVKVKVLEIDRQGRVRLSMKAAIEEKV